MTTGLIHFGAAWAEYVACAPNAMEHRLVPVDRPDTDGLDLKRFAKKGEPFMAMATIFAWSVPGIIARVRVWQGLQGTVNTLHLSQGYIPNVTLSRVRKIATIQQMHQASNSATHRQTLALTFIQLSEDAG